jgi:hypothetical protein
MSVALDLLCYTREKKGGRGGGEGWGEEELMEER